MVNKRSAYLLREYNRNSRCTYLETKFGTPEYTRMMMELGAYLGKSPTTKQIRFALGGLQHLRAMRGRHARAMVFTAIRINRF